MPERLGIIASAKSGRAAVILPIPRAWPARDHAERIARLRVRVDAVIRQTAVLERRRRSRTGGVFAAVSESEAERLRRLPEVVLAAMALIGLWFLPVDFLSDLTPDVTLTVVAAIPCVLVLFIFGGAALWRAWRER